MTKKVYRRSLNYIITGIVILTIAFLIGIINWFNGKAAMGCMAAMSAFGLMLLVFYGLLDNNPRVVIDEDGISAKEWGGIQIFWTDIYDVKIVSLPKAGSSIALVLYDKNKYIRQLSEDERFVRNMSKWFYDAEFSFTANALDAPTTQIYTEIKKRIAQAAEGNIRNAPATEV